MRLYGTPPTRAIRPLWVIRELALECEVIFFSHRAGDHLKPEFRALNPAGRIPVLVDGETVLTESVAICLYLAEKEQDRSLIPADPLIRGQMYRWLFFLVSEIEAPLERMERHRCLYPVEKRSPQAIDLAREECAKMCGVLEEHLNGREFLVGKTLSLADLIAAHTLDWAGEEGLLKNAPRLREFVETLYSRPRAPLTIQGAMEALRAQDYARLTATKGN
jgi:glutathione S-transferase